MKLSLVVAQGVHSGKVIPVTTTEFVIGRDPACQLRPASPAVSKQHCGISVRDGKVYVRDCGSTNGTFVNGEQVAAEREVENGDQLKVGPLEFTLKVEAATASSPALVRPAKAAQAEGAAPTGRAATVVAEPPAKARATTTVVEAEAGEPDTDLDADAAAALLLGGDDGGSATVEAMSSDATTVMETPALGATKAEPAKDEKKKHADSSSAAAEILSKYMRRPRT
ncbi:MAG TPA: FHA domain-containing protein [Gemmataceae bacterium]|jgi:predicted component of type VI protein secretion system|nr:FHA domain-containing protein [Gemmataceae bacterium]